MIDQEIVDRVNRLNQSSLDSICVSAQFENFPFNFIDSEEYFSFRDFFEESKLDEELCDRLGIETEEDEKRLVAYGWYLFGFDRKLSTLYVS